MKTLLKKDLMLLTKQYRMHLILLVFFILAGSVDTTDEFFSTFPLVICCWMNATLIACDERCLWQRQCLLLPISRKMYVQEKYLFQFIVTGIAFLACVLGLSARYGVGSNDFANVLITMLAAAFFVPALVLPIIFKYSAQKSIMKYYAVLVIAVAVCYYFSAAFEARWIASIGLLHCGIMAVLSLAAFFLSYLLSLRFYEKREL